MFSLLLSHSNGLVFEILILIAIFICQAYLAYTIWNKISLYNSIFKGVFEIWSVKEENSMYLKYDGKNLIANTIVLTINNYLDKNRNGVVDFHILKDIVDRNIDAYEEEINQGISAPLYLGLAGTMIGIIIGLYFLGGDTDTELDIGPLLNGVKYAMTVSVIGLAITTFLSVITFKEAKSKVKQGKNDFLSLLQTDLLPSLIKTEGAAIQELSKRLNYFSKNTPGYIKSLNENTTEIKSSIENELNILKEIKQLDVKKMSASNVEIFYSLSGMMETFEAFPRYYAELNSSLGNTITLNKNLDRLVSKTNDVSTILEEVREIIETGNEATTFFNAHIESFEKYSDSVNNAVATADQKMEAALLQLGEAVRNQFNEISKVISVYDSKLTKAFDNSIKLFTETYKNSVPKFEQLDHLAEIENRLDKLNSISSNISSYKLLLEEQNNLLKDFKITLPSDLNLKLKRERGIYFYIREAIIIVASISVVTYVIIHIISIFKN